MIWRPGSGELSKDTLALIGEIVVSWAALEASIDIYLYSYFAFPKNKKFKTSLAIPFKKRLRLWRDMAANLYEKEPEKVAEIVLLTADLIPIRKKRDELVHGVWRQPFEDEPGVAVNQYQRFTDTGMMDAESWEKHDLQNLLNEIIFHHERATVFSVDLPELWKLLKPS